MPSHSSSGLFGPCRGITWLALIAFASHGLAQFNQDFTTVNGQTWWYPEGNGNGPSFTVKSAAPPISTVTVTTTRADNGATVTQTSTDVARSIPTLVYNCHWMPYICKNVDNWMTKHKEQWNSDNVLPLAADLVSSAAYPKENDKSGKRKGPTCQDKRSLYKGFPNNFPARCGAVSQMTVRSNLGTFQPNSNANQPSWIQGNAPDEPSGLVWTCDEFPSSSWVRGGRGRKTLKIYRGKDATVICAPQGVSCFSSPDKASGISAKQGMEQMINALNSGQPSDAQKKLISNRSEQDWQANILNTLKAALYRLHGGGKQPDPKDQTFVAYFHLSTTTAAAVNTKAWVILEDTNTKGQLEKRTVTTLVATRTSKPLVIKPTSESAIITNRAVVPTETTATSVATTTDPSAIGYDAAFASPKPTTYRLLNQDVSPDEIIAAQDLIRKAQDEMRTSNLRKMAHPRVYDSRKMFKGHRSFPNARKLLTRDEDELGPIDSSVPLPTEDDYKPINETVKEAAALIAEFSAKISSNSTVTAKARRQSSAYWLRSMTHGKSPFNPTPGYKVFRDVKVDCKAVGDGVTDDTKAIQDCIAMQDRCGPNCGSTSVAGAVIYFPPGKYLVSSTIEMYFYTQVIGDPLDRPRIIAAPSFVGLGVISSNHYYPDGNGESWYINQSNFLRQVRNLVIDTRNCPYTQIAGIHWQVAQGTSLQNLEFVMPTVARNNAVGMFMENGSGGMFTDVTYRGGFIGMQCGNQQFTTRNVVFDGCVTGITSFWDWGWTWKSLKITGATTAMNIIPDAGDLGRTQQTYSYVILDSVISAPTGILTYPWANDETTGITQLTLDNVDFTGSGIAIKDTQGKTILAGGQRIDSWVLGSVFTKDSPKARKVPGESISPKRGPPQGLLGGPSGGYFERSKPQYENVPGSAFVNALDRGCKGDGKSDDTECLNRIFSKPGYVFLPAGVYLASDTVTIVPGMKIVGESWSQIMATGDKFKNMNNPHVLVRVGVPGDSGNVELQDLMFTVRGNMAGAVLLEWNIKSSSPGAAAMWDCHFRVGGALGSDLQVGQCQKLTGKVNPDCISANMLFHVTSWGSGYFENVWGWVADHDLDIKEQTQIDVYVARGALIESTSPTWMYGTSMEHCVLYQYQIYGARNLFMGMIQTESPYYQSEPSAPAPFGSAVGQNNGDPSFSECTGGSDTCAMSWGLRVSRSEDVLIYGAGLYSWFQKYSQACLPFLNCQDRMVYAASNSRFFLFNLITVGTRDMITAPGTGIMAPGIEFSDKMSNTSSFNAFLMQAGKADIGNGNGTEGNLPGATVELPQSFWWAAGTAPGTVKPITAACTSPCVFKVPPFTFPVLQPPPVTVTRGGRVHTVTPPWLVNATFTINPVHWGTIPVGGITTTDSSGSTTTIYPPRISTVTTTDSNGVSTTYTTTPTTYSASTTTSGQVTIITPSSNQTEIEVPKLTTKVDDDDDDWVISFPPIPIPWPKPKSGCIFFCDEKPPTFPPIIPQPGPPPGPPPPPPPPRGGDDGGEDDDDDDDDDDEEEEENSCPYVIQNSIDVFDVPDENGETVSGKEGKGSATGGSVGRGGIDGSGVGWLDDDGTIIPSPPPSEPNESDPETPTTTDTPTPTTSTTPTTTEALPYPTSTEINRGDVLCWKDYKRDGYESFTSDDAYEATTKFCDSNFTLTPDNNDGVGISHPVGDLNLFASIKWATDQSGCLKKGDLNLSFEYVGCVEAFAATLAECEGIDKPSYLGGGWVFNPIKQDMGGCILIDMHASRKALRALGGPTSSEDISDPSRDMWGSLRAKSSRTRNIFDSHLQRRHARQLM